MSGITGVRYIDKDGNEVLTGGLKAAATNYKLRGADFYAKIGAKGGRNGHTGGFASDVVGKDGLTGRERAKLVGAIGGFRSSRRKDKDAE